MTPHGAVPQQYDVSEAEFSDRGIYRHTYTNLNMSLARTKYPYLPYHDKNKRAIAYDKLILKLKELEPNAAKDGVIKKIKSAE